MSKRKPKTMCSCGKVEIAAGMDFSFIVAGEHRGEHGRRACDTLATLGRSRLPDLEALSPRPAARRRTNT